MNSGQRSAGAAPLTIRRSVTVLLVASALTACDQALGTGAEARYPSGGGDPQGEFRLQCDLPSGSVFDGGVARDGIPSLVNPPLVPADDPGATYLDEYAARVGDPALFPELRVVGIEVEGRAIAIPHNILWWHEIVNLDIGSRRYSVTYCPLTGSALVFDATAAGTERFGVSGLIYNNNLIMFDPETESLWPQMLLSARCGPRKGKQLRTVASIEMRWDAWRARHPDTEVVSSAASAAFNYTAYPYDLYESAPILLFPQEVDRRLGLKERVLGIPDGDGGLAIPFSTLETRGERLAVRVDVGGREMVVLWDASARAARAYERRTGAGPATVEVRGSAFVDRETGSSWNLEGAGISGPRLGERLVPITDSFVAFWFAWAGFHPNTALWQ